MVKITPLSLSELAELKLSRKTPIATNIYSPCLGDLVKDYSRVSVVHAIENGQVTRTRFWDGKTPNRVFVEPLILADLRI